MAMSGCQIPIMPDASTMSAMINEYVSIYLSCVCFNFIYCYNYNRVCLCVCFSQQSFTINNNINTPSVNSFVTMTSFPPSSTRAPQQQLQPERKMAMIVMKYEPTDSCNPSNTQSAALPNANYSNSTTPCRTPATAAQPCWTPSPSRDPSTTLTCR